MLSSPTNTVTDFIKMEYNCKHAIKSLQLSCHDCIISAFLLKRKTLRFDLITTLAKSVKKKHSDH